jgi:hypothetical protein
VQKKKLPGYAFYRINGKCRLLAHHKKRVRNNRNLPMNDIPENINNLTAIRTDKIIA